MRSQQQLPVPLPPPRVIPMPEDRASDSYTLYEELIPVGESGAPGWPHDLWLVADTTRSMVAADQPCWQAPTDGKPRGFTGTMNPHEAVHPTEDRAQDFAEILEDFDRHCHDRVQLDAASWHLPVPVHILNEAEQKEFFSTRFRARPKDGQPSENDARIAAKYKGAPGLFSFSEVFFNTHHTVALVYADLWCGGLCGNRFWSAFSLVNGEWKRLYWNSTVSMS
jgi:hypothetical protein